MVPSSFPRIARDDSSTVPGNTGDSSRPTLAFVGEAPGRNEIARQEVFIGASGQLLNAVLDAYGVQREDVFLGNATLCHYPDSMKSKKGGVPEEAIAACRPRLMEELTLAGVDTVVPMGNSAVTAVVPDLAKRSGITKLRVGRPKTLQHGPTSLLVVPTFHPAACLRRQEQFPQMLTDIGKAVSTMNLPDLWYEPNIFVVTPDKCPSAIINALTGKERLSFLDIETSREKDISYGNVHMNKLLCVGIGEEGEDSVFVFTEECFEDEEFRQRFMTFLSTNRLGAQNGKFDLGALRAYLGYPDFEGPKLSEDTMLGPMPSTNMQVCMDLNTWAWNYWVPMTGSMSFILTLRVQQVRDLQIMQMSLLTFCTNIMPSTYTQLGSCIVTSTERLTHED
jgi:uracil-DNA glycosylase family 4